MHELIKNNRNLQISLSNIYSLVGSLEVKKKLHPMRYTSTDIDKPELINYQNMQLVAYDNFHFK